ncbi:MAG: haloacid dehalogenase [Dehalococcoidia bacterium]|nr:haloacid dehalogenase [Dehalococcoidia bacterium]MDW8119996.1 haloacid dehalogenase [Chloroflexota bacterium]
MTDYAQQLQAIGDTARALLSQTFTAREQALTLCREVVQKSALAIRSAHRQHYEEARRHLAQAQERLQRIDGLLHAHPDVYYAGFVEDAQKEFAEASVVVAVLTGMPIPHFADLKVGVAPYLNGLGEAVGELRRAVMDALRQGDMERCQALLEVMDDIYALLITVDFPDGMTGGLRRTTDATRAILERTQGDVALAQRMHALERHLSRLEGGVGEG